MPITPTKWPDAYIEHWAEIYLSNPEIHYRTTGYEIWEQTEGRVTAFVAGVGTGGTISGVARYLKEQNPEVKIVGADPCPAVARLAEDPAVTVTGYVPDLNAALNEATVFAAPLRFAAAGTRWVTRPRELK